MQRIAMVKQWHTALLLTPLTAQYVGVRAMIGKVVAINGRLSMTNRAGQDVLKGKNFSQILHCFLAQV
jgi:hypothetical protein